MDDDGPGWALALVAFIGRAVLEVESLRKLEIELNRGTLERAPQSVTDRDINLGSVECTIARIEFPLPGVVPLKRVLQLLRDRVKKIH